MEIITKTQEEIVTDEVASFTQHSNLSLENLKINIGLGFNKIWNNPLATPQEMIDRLGNKCAMYFIASKNTQDLIESLDPTYERLVPQYEFTVNEDGTVTLGDLIEDEEVDS